MGVESVGKGARGDTENSPGRGEIRGEPGCSVRSEMGWEKIGLTWSCDFPSAT